MIDDWQDQLDKGDYFKANAAVVNRWLDILATALHHQLNKMAETEEDEHNIESSK